MLQFAQNGQSPDDRVVYCNAGYVFFSTNTTTIILNTSFIWIYLTPTKETWLRKSRFQRCSEQFLKLPLTTYGLQSLLSPFELGTEYFGGSNALRTLSSRLGRWLQTEARTNGTAEARRPKA